MKKSPCSKKKGKKRGNILYKKKEKGSNIGSCPQVPVISEVIKNMVVVFIRKNCIRMVFVYFAFWGLPEEFSTLIINNK